MRSCCLAGLGRLHRSRCGPQCFTQRLRYPQLLPGGDVRVQGQRDDASGRSLGDREVARSISVPPESRLQVNRYRIVDRGLNSQVLENLQEPGRDEGPG